MPHPEPRDPLEQGEWSDVGPPRDPEARRRPSKWDRAVRALQANPGRWLKIKAQTRSMPGYLRGRYPGLIAEGHNGYRDRHGSRRVELWLCWPTDEMRQGAA